MAKPTNKHLILMTKTAEKVHSIRFDATYVGGPVVKSIYVDKGVFDFEAYPEEISVTIEW